MTTSKRFQPWRRAVGILEALLIAGVPFLRINGESALRFDIPTLRLHFFGISLWMEEFFIILAATLFLTFLFLFITIAFGRLWCGWLCPQTVLSDMTGFVEKAAGKGFAKMVRSWMFVLAVSVFIAANLIWYFVSPYDFFSQLVSGSMGPVTRGFWVILTAILFLNFVLVRRRFCATVCPYAKIQGVLYDENTLVIAMDERRMRECIDCEACVRGCPVGIDIRNGLSDACINCAECIDRCAAVMNAREKPSLIGYFFGTGGGTGRLLRLNVVIAGGTALVFLVFFLFLLFTRVPLDFAVSPNISFASRLSREGRVVNSYVLSIHNRGRQDEEVEIIAEGVEGPVKTVPAGPLLIPAGESNKVTLFVSLPRTAGNGFPDMIEISLRAVSGNYRTAGREIRVQLPEGQ